MKAEREDLTAMAQAFIAIEARDRGRYYRLIGIIAIASLSNPFVSILGAIVIGLIIYHKETREWLTRTEKSKTEQLNLIKAHGLQIGPHVAAIFPSYWVFRLAYKECSRELVYGSSEMEGAEIVAETLRKASEARQIRLSEVAFLQQFPGKVEVAVERGKYILIFDVEYELKQTDELFELIDRFPSNESLVRALRNGCRQAAQSVLMKRDTLKKGDGFELPGLPYRATVANTPKLYMSNSWAAQSKR